MLSRLLPKSLTLRAIGLSTLWAAISLVAIASVIISLYRDASERNFSSLLSAHLFNLIAASSVDDTGRLMGSPDLGDLRYTIPDSGWYWSVEPVSDKVTGKLSSLSMTNKIIQSVDPKIAPFDSQFRRTYAFPGLDGEALEIAETEFEMGSADRIARFRVMGNRSEVEAEITAFAQRLYTYLALFGLGSIAVNAMAILLGLNPLRKARESLKQIREGKAHKLDGEFPPEIAPLASEMNALIDNNRRIVERSRTQVGNLAHSLKTPLAVMANEGRALGGKAGTVIADQAGAMQQQIQHYLQRARIAAQRDSVVFRAPVTPILIRLQRVMQKLNPQKSFEFSPPSSEIVFAGEAEDLEEVVGNLLENAAKWGRKRVLINVAMSSKPGVTPMLELEISDDGPGLANDQMAQALERGKRLDESKPGTGLGLSIVADTVREYGGSIRLAKSQLGGLSVSISLPMVEQTGTN
jgi:signal transduction histidine kinase